MDNNTQIYILIPALKASLSLFSTPNSASCKAKVLEQTSDGESSPIVVAPRPKRPYPNIIAPPSDIAFTMDQKYTMGIPLYRQEQQWHRSGVSISRQTLSIWVVDNAHYWLESVWNRMKEHLLLSESIPEHCRNRK